MRTTHTTHTTQPPETGGAAIEWAVATVLWLDPARWDAARAVVPAHEPLTVRAWLRALRADDARVVSISPAIDAPGHTWDRGRVLTLAGTRGRSYFLLPPPAQVVLPDLLDPTTPVSA
jgi:hypothetical protein